MLHLRSWVHGHSVVDLLRRNPGCSYYNHCS
jgi:hypothetical protein